MGSLKDEKPVETHETQDNSDVDTALVSSTQLVNEDVTTWYQKPNLRRMYYFLVPAALGVEMTSGFDSQMINTVQIAPAWQACEYHIPLLMNRYM